MKFTFPRTLAYPPDISDINQQTLGSIPFQCYLAYAYMNSPGTFPRHPPLLPDPADPNVVPFVKDCLINGLGSNIVAVGLTEVSDWVP